jgi:tetrahydromethanopterin S-methyltransferase subunit E
VVGSFVCCGMASLGGSTSASFDACSIILVLARVWELLLLLEPFALPMIAALYGCVGSLNGWSHFFDQSRRLLCYLFSVLSSGCLVFVVWVVHPFCILFRCNYLFPLTYYP